MDRKLPLKLIPKNIQMVLRLGLDFNFIERDKNKNEIRGKLANLLTNFDNNSIKLNKNNNELKKLIKILFNETR